jgi:hypothetical protein
MLSQSPVTLGRSVPHRLLVGESEAGQETDWCREGEPAMESVPELRLGHPRGTVAPRMHEQSVMETLHCVDGW